MCIGVHVAPRASLELSPLSAALLETPQLCEAQTDSLGVKAVFFS